MIATADVVMRWLGGSAYAWLGLVLLGAVALAAWAVSQGRGRS